ncbi:MAG TPA: primosomal protein DnaI [Firmicutes bacterium]|nr:primosomal protein DnaI [Bacillota bacterium]
MISNRVDENMLKKEYSKALKDEQFRKLIKRLEVDDEDAMKYTSSLECTVCELNNCAKCDGLIYCKNRLDGHVFFPIKNGKQIIFSYAPCKYQKEEEKKEINRPTREKDILNAKMSDIDVTDKKRYDVIKWLKSFYDKYDKTKEQKGLYLHGNFGCGKTYLIAALFNELAKKKVRTEIVYFPELLRDIKSDFDSYGDRIEYLENVDLLLIDDIGAEKVTEWSRDEILGTILQKRMNNYKTTFFTSNLNIVELESHLKGKNYTIDDEIKARRIIERIKQLTVDMEMIGENKRK